MSQNHDNVDGGSQSRVSVHHACMKEIQKFPYVVQENFLDLSARLELGEKLSMPTSRSMPDIGKGVHELRIKKEGGQYRIVYFLKSKAGLIYFIHAFKKKTQATPNRNIDLAKKRLREVLR